MTKDAKILQSIVDEVSAVYRKVDKGFSEVNSRIDGTNIRLDKLEQSVVKIQKHLALSDS